MDKRTVAIIIALLSPVAVMALVAVNAPEEAPPTGPGTATVVPDRLPPTQDNARPDDGGHVPPPPRAPREPLTLEQARERAKKELEWLNALTPEQGEVEQRRRMERRGGHKPPPEH